MCSHYISAFNEVIEWEVTKQKIATNDSHGTGLIFLTVMKSFVRPFKTYSK